MAQQHWVEATALFDEGIAIFREIEDDYHLSNLLFYKGKLKWMQAKYEAAQALTEESIGLALATGRTQYVLKGGIQLAQLAHERGQSEVACQQLEALLPTAQTDLQREMVEEALRAVINGRA